MRVLLLQPEDFLHSGPWSAQAWDLIVNLGRSPLSLEQTYDSARVLHANTYNQGLSDARIVREILHTGRGRLIDSEGIDWWELTSIAVVQQAFAVLQLQRLAGEIPSAAELWSTRPDWTTGVLADLLHTSVRTFRSGRWTRTTSATRHYLQVLHHFSPSQIKQIFFDKYDAGYRWRSRFSGKPSPCSERVLLVPSAYANVSRMAASYAGSLPNLHFLFVATRQSAHEFLPPENVELRDLAAYAQLLPEHSELALLMGAWTKLESDLHASEPLRLLSAAGILDQIPAFLQSGLCVRNAWRQVLESEPVCSVFCGDDSNFFTRLPVLLAAKRNIPTVDFHHGALDGLYLFKDLPSDLYLAKSEMERDYLVRLCELPSDKVVIGPPLVRPKISSGSKNLDRGSIVLFSEPYENSGMRGEDVYREMLRPLWLLARHHDRELVIKLHPFESRVQRRRMAKRVLPPEAMRHVKWIQGPLTSGLLERTWFGITIESTTAIECAQNGVCCFLCRWLTLAPYGYAEQYARFAMGESLESPQQISEIPARVEEFHKRRRATPAETTDPSHLLQWLTCGCRETVQARSAS
jgi:hypothetical protein